MFTIYDVDYYPAVSIGEIPQILNHGYCYLLYDFGVLTEANYNEFLRCDRKIVIGTNLFNQLLSGRNQGKTFTI